VPFSAHFDVDGEPSAVGVMVPEDTAWIDVRRAGDLEFELTAAGRADRVGVRVVVGSVAAVSSRRIVGGRCRIEFDRSADERIETMTAVGAEVQLRWSGERVTGWISVGDEAANATP